MKNDIKIDRNTVFNSFIWKTLERVLTQGINLAVQVVLARLLLTEVFGSLALIVSITTFANIFVQSGLATSIIQKQDLDELDIATVFTVSLGIAAILYIILFILAPVISNFYQILELKWALRVLALILFLNSIYSVENALLSRQMKFKQLLKRSMIAIPIAGVLSISLAYLGYGIWALVAFSLTNMLVTVLVLSIGTNIKLKFGFSLSRAKQIYSFSGKILIANLITGSHDAIRTMVIGKVYTSSDLAYYDKAYTYAGYISDLARDSIGGVLLPAFSRSQNALDELRRMARKSVSMSAFFMLPILVGFAMVARPVVLVLLTSKWESSILFLVVFCFLRIPTILKNVDFQVYYALGKSEINLIYCIAFCVINIISLLVSVRYGVIYVAIAATITEYLSYVVIVLLSSRIYGYSVKDRFLDLFKPMLNSAVMGLSVWAIGFLSLSIIPLLICQVTVGIVVYLTMCLLTREKNLKLLIDLLKVKMGKHNTK